MAYSHDFDPAKGFVALPSDLLDIEMSPGAFRLLVELCRMANRSGECWPSLGQLSERIGRSKAAISGYIAELREIDLVATLNQKMANGYNYRLKYCIVFWQKWRNQLSSTAKAETHKNTKRSVQPSERRVNSKNHINKTHSPEIDPADTAAHNSKLVSVFSKWSNLSKSAPFPTFNSPIPEDLVMDTRNIVALKQPISMRLDVIYASLLNIWEGLGVKIDPAEIKHQSMLLHKRNTTDEGFTVFEQTLNKLWQEHWRKLPTNEQFDDILLQASSSNRTEGMVRMLEQYLRRWEITQNKLHQTKHSPSLAINQAA